MAILAIFHPYVKLYFNYLILEWEEQLNFSLKLILKIYTKKFTFNNTICILWRAPPLNLFFIVLTLFLPFSHFKKLRFIINILKLKLIYY